MNGLSPRLKAVKRQRLLRSQLFFTREFFSEKEGQEFIVGPHHDVMCRTLDKVFSGEIKRLIINIPPGYSKTELAVINFIARGFAINPRSRFMHASYSEDLALDNSGQVKELISMEGYQEFWPISLKIDAKGKKLWKTSQGGALRASGAGQSVTGFRAGRLTPEGKDWTFSGALVIDDPLKPSDARSKKERDNVNSRWHNTFRSRLAEEATPVIVIMQRLHVEDYVAELLNNSGEKWHHLKLPVLVGPERESHINAIPISHNLANGPLWERKHTEKQIEILKNSDSVFSGQYMQEPIVDGGNLFREEWLGYYEQPPKIKWRAIYADTAQKTKERNDYSVFQEWGAGEDGKAYLLDQVRGKFEAPELDKVAKSFWNKTKSRDADNYGYLRKFAVEDKASGTGLLQGMKRESVPIYAIQRSTDKITRAMDVAPSMAAGLVFLPKDATWLREWKEEYKSFPDGSHDDQMDPMIDAVGEMCGHSTYNLDNL